MRKFLLAAGTAIVMASAASSASAATNLLTNGSFESGDFTGWTTNFVPGTDNGGGDTTPVVIAYNQPGNFPLGAFGESIPVDTLSGGADQASGRYAAYFSSDFTASETISQSIALVAGTSYTFGFDYYLPANGQVNPFNATFSASFAGNSIGTLSAAAQPTQSWQSISQTFTALSSGPGTLALSFASNGFPAKDFVIDRVYVTSTSSLVPEPASWAMMVGGFGLMGAALRRKRANPLFA